MRYVETSMLVALFVVALFIAACPATTPDGSLCPARSEIRDVTFYAGEIVVRRFDAVCFETTDKESGMRPCAQIYSAESGYVTFCGTFIASEPKK